MPPDANASSGVVAPEDAWRDITNAWQLRTRQLACLQLLADWRLRKARERDLAVNFVVREEHLWSLALYAGKFRRTGQPGLSVAKSAFTKTLLALVEKAQTLPEDALPQPMLT